MARRYKKKPTARGIMKKRLLSAARAPQRKRLGRATRTRALSVVPNAQLVANLPFRGSIAKQSINTLTATYLRARTKAIAAVVRKGDTRAAQDRALLRMSNRRGALWYELLGRWKKKEHVMKN